MNCAIDIADGMLQYRRDKQKVFLVTDAYSRKIVGYAVDANPLRSIIHHSNRGLQYCSKEYVSIACANNIILLSMIENGDSNENALAERMNRTIKEGFGLDRRIKQRTG